VAVAALIAALLMTTIAASPVAAETESGTDLAPRARIVDIEPIIDENGQLWYRLHFEQPWGEMPPFDLFSFWFGIGTAAGEASSWVGLEHHAGIRTPYESTGAAGNSGAFALADGTVVVATGLFPTSPIGIAVLMASWRHETETTRQADEFETSFQPADFIHGDPLHLFGAPTWNLVTDEQIGGTPPEAEEAPDDDATVATPATPTDDANSDEDNTPEASPSQDTPSEAGTLDDGADAAPATPAVDSDTPVTTSATVGASSNGLTREQKIALVILAMFLLWMTFVYFSTRTVGAAPDPCASEKAAVDTAKKKLEEAKKRQAARSAARSQAEAERSALTFAEPGHGPQKASRDADNAVDEANRAEDIAKSHTEIAQNEVLAAEAKLAACEKRADASSPSTTSTGGTPATAPPPPGPTTPSQPAPGPTEAEESTCCPSGNWIGVNVFSGGTFFVGGAEWGIIHLVCIDNPDRTATVSWKGYRVGPGLGAEISGGLFVVVGGPTHPKELEKSVESILGGVDFDLSLGASWTKLAKASVKSGRSLKQLKTVVEQLRDGSKALDKARKAGNIQEATQIAAKNSGLVKELVRDGKLGKLADAAAEVGTKSALSGGQALGSGVNIPLGVGLQVGIWNVFGVEAMLQAWDGCEECGSY